MKESESKPGIALKFIGYSLLAIALFYYFIAVVFSDESVPGQKTQNSEATENVKTAIKNNFTEFQNSEWVMTDGDWVLISKDPLVSVKLGGGKLEMFSMTAGLPNMMRSVGRCSKLGNMSFSFNPSEKEKFDEFMMAFISGKNPNTFAHNNQTFYISNEDTALGEATVNNFTCGIK